MGEMGRNALAVFDPRTQAFQEITPPHGRSGIMGIQVAADDTGSTAINYGVTGVPETFFLDRHGVIVSKVIGELTAQTMQRNLQLLAH